MKDCRRKLTKIGWFYSENSSKDGKRVHTQYYLGKQVVAQRKRQAADRAIAKRGREASAVEEETKDKEKAIEQLKQRTGIIGT